ncbi:hypothetical protein [Roseovarius nubinhibens]|uniref:Uncharacterized protein n=1 Tax=Roseovarius nubinhibens (strain ATCC BAA-591 / DSM 15170 / ISM) TaxID=89187 RepID=A3SKG9_ROSNI|nr:hypothetical protein [Roseovarius nubinhibens]EAP77850.1 hypothetical protein ISM_06135 [Roseovarius nubinhibens ISM]
MTERDKRQKFEELAEKRVNKVIKDLRLIGNLSNRNNYSFDDGDVRKIMKALDDELKALKVRFTQARPSEKDFKL